MSTPEPQTGLTFEGDLRRDAHEVLAPHARLLAESLVSDDTWPNSIWERAELAGHLARALGRVSPCDGGEIPTGPVLLDGDDLDALYEAAEFGADLWGSMAGDEVLTESVREGDPDAIRHQERYRRNEAHALRVLSHIGNADPSSGTCPHCRGRLSIRIWRSQGGRMRRR